MFIGPGLVFSFRTWIEHEVRPARLRDHDGAPRRVEAVVEDEAVRLVGQVVEPVGAAGPGHLHGPIDA